MDPFAETRRSAIKLATICSTPKWKTYYQERIRWFYTTITGKLASPFIGELVYKNFTGEGKVVVMSNGRNILDNHEDLAQHEAFKLDKDGISFVKFDIRDFDCDVVLSNGTIMVEKTDVQPPVEDVTANMLITVGCVMGAAVVMVIVTCFLCYWFGYRKKQKNEIDEEKVVKQVPEDKTKKN
uniref:Uncharacterized protein n=1 Tax=Panagrolaimus sp. JU765 TaxID=591449 RepID=A0AC34RRT2_9BILA